MKKKLLLGSFLVCTLTAQGSDSDENKGLIRLDEKVITAERFVTTTRNTAKNITIITRSDIEKKGAKDIIEALEGIPGVKAQNSFGSGTVDIRGQGDTQISNILILVDGIPQNTMTLSGPRLKNIAIQSVERIEVFPGGGAVLYGDGAVGGVVNIITRSSSSDEGYGFISVESGSDGMLNYGASYSSKVSDNVIFYLNYWDNNRDGYRDNGQYNTENLEVSSKYLLSDSESILFNYGKHEEEYGLPGSLTKDQVNLDRRQTTKPSERAEINKNSYSISANKIVTENLEFLIDTNYYDSDSFSEYTYYTGEKNIDQTTLNPKLKSSYGNGSYLIGGFDYLKGKNITDYPDFGLEYHYEKESKGYFLLNKLLWNNFEFVQGYRYESTKYNFSGDASQDDKYYNNEAVELSANYLYSDTGSTFISFSEGFRTPKTDEIYSEKNEGNLLEPQTHKTIEIGVKDFILNSYITASVFKTEIEDEIFYDKQGSPAQNRNLDGTTERAGFEFAAEQYHGRLTLRESFTYLDHEITEGIYEDNYIPGVSAHQYSLGVAYEFSENLSFNTSLNYFGSFYASADFENTTEKEDSYITIDSKISYNFKNGLTVYGGIDNLFDEEYYEYVGYTTASGYDNNKSYYPAAERTYYVGAQYKL